MCFGKRYGSNDYLLRGDSDLPQQEKIFSGKARALKSATVTFLVDSNVDKHETVTIQKFLNNNKTKDPFDGYTEIYATFNDEEYITKIVQYWQS